jgi:hypothetical protein
MMTRFLQLFTLVALFTSCGFGDDAASISEGGTSQGGSLARFTIIGDYLYVVNDFDLVPVNIANLENPITQPTVEIGFGIETIFPYNNHLFIGSASAVYIYDLVNPAAPRQRSVYAHSTGCDPVVVSGDYAYVTLREGFACGNPVAVNVLEVVNVSNYDDPYTVQTIWMNNPRGLGIGCDNKLFVCEGPWGLAEFDITNPESPIETARYTDHAANDVIIRGDLMIVTGEDGIYQYSCAGDSLSLLSVLPLAL